MADMIRPECLGLPCASLYLLLMMLFIPFPFSHIFQTSSNHGIGREKFPTGEVGDLEVIMLTHS